MSSSSKGNDRRRPFPRDRAATDFRPSRRPAETGGAEWLWGRHAVDAALANPARESFHRLLATSGKASHLEAALTERNLRVETAEPNEIARLLPAGAVHQGLALLADPLPDVALEDLAEPAEGVIVLLDQVADPQNVGAIFRSAAAFGARGIIMQDRRAPPLSGALA
ncbi:MAG: RNA methyltransferase substrate-binding domain-containing protein, partial [Caulobacteraceae bacterium]